MTDLAEIRAALAAATPGPWDDVVSTWEVRALGKVDHGFRVCEVFAAGDPAQGPHAGNKALIANTPTWLAELCDRVERAEGHVANLRIYREDWQTRAETAEAEVVRLVREVARLTEEHKRAVIAVLKDPASPLDLSVKDALLDNPGR